MDMGYQWDIHGIWMNMIRRILIFVLVGGLVAINFMFPEMLGFDYHPNGRTHIFQVGVACPHQPDMVNING